LINEVITIGFHFVGFQAGFSIASTVDPTSTADVTVLESLGSLTAGLLFFTTGLHRSLIAAFARSLMIHPAGNWTLSGDAVDAVLQMSGLMLSAGLRLAFPIVASVLLVDLAMALLGRFNGNLQLLALSFPAKILASLILVGLMMAAVPTLFHDVSERGMSSLYRVIGN
jgi:flagellar biosynthetic protein FliR